jgi:hypothetical protein
LFVGKFLFPFSGAWRIKDGWGGPNYSYIGSNSMYYANIIWAPKRETAFFVVSNAGSENSKDAVTDAMKALLEAFS